MSAFPIAAKKLTRDFAENRALDELTLEVEAGRVVALLGPNGAGKTTLFRLLLGLIKPTAGESTVLGHSSRTVPGAVRGRIACLGDGYDPPRWAKLSQVLALQAEASPKFDQAAARALLAELELSPRRRYGALSKGQKRWALAALVLASGADLMLMDEPADGLDPSARRSLYNHIRQIVNERDSTVLISTHIIGDVERVADDVAIIDHGRLRLQAALEDLREQVREIELPGENHLPGHGEELELLGERDDGPVRLAWMRGSVEAWGEYEQQLPVAAVTRPVNLETLYLALTGHRAQDEDQDTQVETVNSQEAMSCV